MTSNAIAYFTQKETQRSNLAREAETLRHNRATEQIEREKLDLARQQHGEVVRHNVVTEGYNYSVLGENVRHNMASEEIGRGQVAVGFANVGLGYAQLAESERAHRAAEAEAHRHQVAMEAETQKHNRVTERIQKQDSTTRKTEAATNRWAAEQSDKRALQRNLIDAHKAETDRMRQATYEEDVNNRYWLGIWNSAHTTLSDITPYLILGGM